MARLELDKLCSRAAMPIPQLQEKGARRKLSYVYSSKIQAQFSLHHMLSANVCDDIAARFSRGYV